MSIFQEVRFGWKGEHYLLPPDKVLPCIAAVEGVITLGELAGFTGSTRLPLARLAMAFATALRFAGAKVTAEEVYDGMFGAASGNLVAAAMDAAFLLHKLMVPPEHFKAAEKKVAEEGKATAGAGSGTEDKSQSATASSSARNT